MNNKNIKEVCESMLSELAEVIVSAKICQDNYNPELENENNKIKENILELVSNLNNSKKIIENIIDECNFANCSHEYISDYIDINPESSQKIIYCKYCNMLK